MSEVPLQIRKEALSPQDIQRPPSTSARRNTAPTSPATTASPLLHRTLAPTQISSAQPDACVAENT